jgi:hypothetical protein
MAVRRLIETWEVELDGSILPHRQQFRWVLSACSVNNPEHETPRSREVHLGEDQKAERADELRRPVVVVSFTEVVLIAMAWSLGDVVTTG